MSGNKFIRKSIPVVAALVLSGALCLAASVSSAQTPAQDDARVAADQKARDEAKSAIKNDSAQLSADQTAQNEAAVKTDAEALAADKQKETAAEDQLKADTQQQSSDQTRFNGPPPAAPAPPAQAVIPGTYGAAPAGSANMPGTNVVAPAAPVEILVAPAPAPATGAGTPEATTP
jgi:hypothetical protein